VTTVFYLFLLHQALGLLLALCFVTERAGERFFKFCSATSAVMIGLGMALLVRRFGFDGDPRAPGGAAYALVLLTSAAALVLAMLYNRAWHFGWMRLMRPLLALAIGAGVAGVLLGSPSDHRALVAAADLTSILLLGAAASAMILGHFYLVVLDLPISALRKLTLLLVVGLALRALVVGFALLGPSEAGFEGARLVASGLWSADGVFVWMRLLFGIAGPLSLIWFIWKTVEIRSTQSATGILYVQLFLVLSGELLAKYLRVAAGLAL
jgi:hypothetical protein